MTFCSDHLLSCPSLGFVVTASAVVRGSGPPPSRALWLQTGPTAGSGTPPVLTFPTSHLPLPPSPGELAAALGPYPRPPGQDFGSKLQAAGGEDYGKANRASLENVPLCERVSRTDLGASERQGRASHDHGGLGRAAHASQLRPTGRMRKRK